MSLPGNNPLSTRANTRTFLNRMQRQHRSIKPSSRLCKSCITRQCQLCSAVIALFFKTRFSEEGTCSSHSKPKNIPCLPAWRHQDQSAMTWREWLIRRVGPICDIGGIEEGSKSVAPYESKGLQMSVSICFRELTGLKSPLQKCSRVIIKLSVMCNLSEP